MDIKQLLNISIIRPVVLALPIAVAARGGGGSSDSSSSDTLDDTQTVQDEQEVADTSDNEGVTEGGSTDGVSGSQEDSGQSGSVIDDDTQSGDETGGSGSDPDVEDISEGSDPLESIGQPVIIVAEDAPAPGAEDVDIARLGFGNSFDATTSGDVFFTASFPGIFNNDGWSGGVWGGTIGEPRLLLRAGMAIEGFPANVRVSVADERSFSMAADGTIAGLVTMSGARTVETVMRSSPTGMQAIFRSDQGVAIDGENLMLDNFSFVEHAVGKVAVLGGEGIGSDDLFLFEDDTISRIAPGGGFISDELRAQAPLQADGCRIVLPGNGRNAGGDVQPTIRNDGSLMFNAQVVVEAGALSNAAICPDRFRVINSSMFQSDRLVGDAFATVVKYSDGAYSRIVSSGDPVPGMAQAVFIDPSLEGVLTDDTMLVSADVRDTTSDRDMRSSLWIFSDTAAPRLVLLSGETVESSVLAQQYTINASVGFGTSGVNEIDVNAGGRTLVLDLPSTNDDGGTGWVLAGEAHQGQPYSDYNALGESPLQVVVATGYPAPTGFAETTFWSSIANASLLPEAGGVFGGTITDSDPAATVTATSALWQFDANNEISQLLPRELTVTVNEIPRTLTIPVTGDYRLIGNAGILYIDSTSPSSILIYLPFSQ